VIKIANTEAVGGVDTYVLYVEEATYATDPGSGYAHIGLTKSFKPTVNNEVTKLRGFVGSASGGRDVAKFVPGKHVASAVWEFDVNDWQFLKFVLGTETGSGPYTYTGANLPPSLTIHYPIDNPGGSSTDRDGILLGSVIDSCTIRCAVGEPVSCTLNVMSAYNMYDTNIISNAAMISDDVFDFTGGSIELPDGSTISNIIDSIEITIKNNWEILYGIGSRLGQNAKPKEREYTIKFTLKYLDNDMWEKLQGAATPTATGGPTENATIALKFEKGTQSADFVFTTFVFDDGTLNMELNQVLTEDLSGTASSLSVTDDRS